MTLQELLQTLGTGGISAIIFVLLTFVEIIPPIKIKPWSFLLNWLGKKLNGKLQEEVRTLNTVVDKLKKDFEDKNAHDKRWSILDFANSCHNGRRHTKEEWGHVLNQLIFYEEYVKEHDIDNAVIEEETRYLRKLYRELLTDNAFIGCDNHE